MLTEEKLAEIKENNDEGLYEEVFVPTPVIDALLVDIRTLQQQVNRIKQEVEDWKNGYNAKDALIEIEKIVGETP